MTATAKLVQLKALLQITDATKDATLAAYLNFAKLEILSWLYSGDTPDDVTDVPAQYEPTQIAACVVAYGVSGGEGETGHSENGISRTFRYEDMVAYIRTHVYPYVVAV